MVFVTFSPQALHGLGLLTMTTSHLTEGQSMEGLYRALKKEASEFSSELNPFGRISLNSLIGEFWRRLDQSPFSSIKASFLANLARKGCIFQGGVPTRAIINCTRTGKIKEDISGITGPSIDFTKIHSVVECIKVLPSWEDLYKDSLQLSNQRLTSAEPKALAL